ncbi:hypothetical protein UFOVP411_40 [uncultured Caudovirales phage]|uniref:Uncharacterized protein n=1 Tax=uncultured Caudovirales phage TaxID=2100421 RepID=A0A6J5MBH6_9CAUD|nr:hypothetical protein UFOVP411_40 [uncultured Caudovirales phage]
MTAALVATAGAALILLALSVGAVVWSKRLRAEAEATPRWDGTRAGELYKLADDLKDVTPGLILGGIVLLLVAAVWALFGALLVALGVAKWG